MRLDSQAFQMDLEKIFLAGSRKDINLDFGGLVMVLASIRLRYDMTIQNCRLIIIKILGPDNALDAFKIDLCTKHYHP